MQPTVGLYYQPVAGLLYLLLKVGGGHLQLASFQGLSTV